MEGTKYKIPGFFFQEKIYPTTNAATASSTIESIHNDYHNQWQPQLLGHLPLEGGLCSVRDMQPRNFKPFTFPAFSSISNTGPRIRTKTYSCTHLPPTTECQMSAEHN